MEVIGKRASLCLASFLALLLSCQRTELSRVTIAQVVARLQEGAKQPYGCNAQGTVLVSFDNLQEFETFEMEIQYFQLNKWVSCHLFESSLFGRPQPTQFVKNMNGLRHSLTEPYTEGGYVEWECDSFWEGNLPSLGLQLYPPGGWDLCSQAIGLINKYQPSDLKVVGKGLLVEWESVPQDFSNDLLKYNKYFSWGEDSVVDLPPEKWTHALV